MRVSCLQENLAKGLSIVGRAVSTRSTLPVLGNILLATDRSRLKLSATDLEIAINCWIGAQVQEEGAITVPARLLTEFINSLPAERIDMALNVRTQSLYIRCARTEGNIKGIDANEFPLIPTSDDGQRTTEDGRPTSSLAYGPSSLIPVSTLRKMVEQVAFAAATDDSRPILTGVHARLQGDRLTLAATDGFRLSVRWAQLTPTPVPPPASGGGAGVGDVIIPARSLQEVARISADADEEYPVEMRVIQARNQVLFHLTGKADGAGKGGFQQVDVISQLIEGNFPDYMAIIPKAWTTRVVVDTAEFLKAVRVAYLFARDAANIVRLLIAPGGGEQPGTLTLQATSAEYGDNVSQLEAQSVEGAPIEIAFNARYLIDVLNVVGSPQVALEMTRPSAPGVIRPIGVGPEEFTHVIMPMHISRS
ncbi:MAG: DNA polymerase III subunit beta [Anaerolineae bacterium]|nr:DNA polymerase III subunit beta [Anaerolineae bacterium]MDW8099444.1 DNA polymerase III subunit beta [Anaerolineae bacterium]